MLTKRLPFKGIFIFVFLVLLVFFAKVTNMFPVKVAGDSHEKSTGKPASVHSGDIASTAGEQSRKNASGRQPEKKGISPEEAGTMLQNASRITNMLDQVKAYCQITRELCEAGYYEEAWHLILAEPGANRSAQLGVFFSLVPAEFGSCASKVESLPDSVEKSIALQSFLGGRSGQFPGLLENPDFKRICQELGSTDPNALVKIIGGGLRIKFDGAESAEKEEINRSVLEYYSKKLISDFDFATMITRNASKPPLELWSWVSNNSFGTANPETFEGQLRSGIVNNMVMEDPLKALSEISKENGRSAAGDLYYALNQWASMDSKGANQWYLDNRANLTDAQRDHAAKAFSLLALRYGELKGAETWANEIQDAGLRNTLKQQISPGASKD